MLNIMRQNADRPGASLQDAGRGAHLRILGVATACAVVVILIGINARDVDTANVRGLPADAAVKAISPLAWASEQTPEIR